MNSLRVCIVAPGKAILGGDGPDDIKQLDFTSWLKSTQQEFELGVQAADHDFEYRIHIEQAHGDVSHRRELVC
jgi:hypothetical protein